MADKANECQEQAIEEIQTWMLEPNSKYHVLSGPPGTGKSWVVNNIEDKLEETSQLAQVLDASSTDYMLKGATTNKAATNIEGDTLHRIFGLRPKKVGPKLEYVPSNRTKVLQNVLLVVDECSMKDTHLLNIVDEFTDDSCKILEVGDRFQLAPVNEKVSPVFNQGWGISELNTPVRQDINSDLYATCKQLRAMVEGNYEEPLLFNSQVRCIDDDEMGEFLETMTVDDRLIGFTNNFCISLNQTARQLQGIEDELWVPGEKLVSNGVVQSGKSILLTNEQEVIVSAIHSESHDVYGVPCYTVVTEGGLHLSVPFNHQEYDRAMKAASRESDWNALYGLKETVADLRGANTVTATKSQGSTYNRVAINMNNIRKARHMLGLNQYLRMLYVAISRAKVEVLVYGY